MFFCFKRPTFPCSPNTVMCIKYFVSCPRNFFSSLNKVKTVTVHMAVANQKETEKLSVTLKEETAVFQRHKQKLSLKNCSLRKGD